MSVSILKTVLVNLDDLVFWILVLFMSQDDTHYQNHRNDPHELRVVRASMQYLKYRCALLYFYHIYVGVIDRTNISNIWFYLFPIIACVVSNIGLSTFHLKLFATLCNKSSAHSIYQQFFIIDMDSFLITKMFGG